MSNNHTSYQRGGSLYNPVPTFSMIDENKEAQEDNDNNTIINNNHDNIKNRNRKVLYMTTAFILILFGVSMINDENQRRGEIHGHEHNMIRVSERRDSDTDHHYSSSNHPHQRRRNKKEHKKDNGIEPTLKPNGGRDWTINVEEGTIAAKHNPELVLGSYPYSPLVLTHRGESNQIVFPISELQSLKMQGSVSKLSGIGLQFPQEQHPDAEKEYHEWKYVEMGASPAPSSSQSATSTSTSTSNLLSLSNVDFIDDNFITWRNNDGNDMVLDVSLWAEVAGNTVNLVRANPDHKSKNWWDWNKWFPPQTFKYGGGRDWVLNLDDGTIGCKNTPFLVLGYAPIRLLLMEKGSLGANTFEKGSLEALANNETTTLILANDNNDGDDMKMAIGKLEDKEQYFGPYRYIESSIVPESEATPLKYIENNYIATAEPGVPYEKALVLDVSFWQMISGNTVNFVGGFTWEETANDGNDHDDDDDDDDDNHKGEDDGYYKNIDSN